MLAAKDITNRNEPLLARHARWVHQKHRRAFRLAHLKGMHPEQAVAVLKPTHERRAREVGNESSADILNDLAIEDMRRAIHQAYLARCTKVLMLAAAIAVAGVYIGVVQMSRHTDDLKHVYIVARGLPDVTDGAVVRDVATKAGQAGKQGFRAWLREKLGKGQQPEQQQ